MKKLCLILACLSFISVMPSQAMKIIVNNENDRIVYSRSSGYEEERYLEEQQNIEQEQNQDFASENNNEQVNHENEEFNHQDEQVSNENGNGELNSYIRKLKDENPDKYHEQLDMLKWDFRTELAGTRWADGEQEPPAPIAEENSAPMEGQMVQENQEPTEEQIVNNEEDERIMQYRANLQRYKRGSREAADYYMVDMQKDPNNLVPSGYNQPY